MARHKIEEKKKRLKEKVGANPMLPLDVTHWDSGIQIVTFQRQ